MSVVTLNAYSRMGNNIETIAETLTPARAAKAIEDKAFEVKSSPLKRSSKDTVMTFTTSTEKLPQRRAERFLHRITLKAAVRLPTKA